MADEGGWTDFPDDAADLPWAVRAGRRMLWYIDFGDDHPRPKGVVAGSWSDESGGVVKQPDDGSGYYRKVVKAYRELPALPSA